jgi:hypothetical protein
MRKRRAQNTGAIYVETLITLPIVMYFALITWQLIDLAIAGYLARHAAICAARAAATIGPDSNRHYGGQSQDDIAGGQRHEAIREAANRALQGNKHFTTGNFGLVMGGSTNLGGMVSATLTVDYTCKLAALNAVCAGGGTRTLKVTEEFPYQAANVNWE